MPRVLAVSGCGRDVGPTALDCPRPPPALTIAGGHFGPSGTNVTLWSGSTPGHCGAVEHRADSVLICHAPALPPVPLPALGLYLDVEVTTRYGTSHALDRAVLIAGAPVLVALVARSPACVRLDPRALRDCPGTGTAFGVVGEGLVAMGPTAVTVGGVPCPAVVPYNASYVECHGITGAPGTHAVAVEVGLNRHRSIPADPPFTVNFVDPCAQKPGHWTGAQCDACKPLYYGPACALRCQEVAGAVCSGHGVCDDGTRGTGACLCYADAERGQWEGAACARCQAGFAGPDCRARCPSGGGRPCGGHGMCSAGATGAGRCACDPAWVGPACTARCPGDAAPCSGHGRCRWVKKAAAAVCMCDAGPTGYWAGADCGGCHAGYIGPQCATECPGGAATPCGGHGSCRAPGLCACEAGYAGPHCLAVCPGLTDGRVCNGHGRCDADTGACACAGGGNGTGHWAGPGCAACADGWSGAACTAPCPRGSGAVCGGHGACADGACACAAGYCGAVCEGTGAGCARCAAGTWGPRCAGECPGGTGAPCHGHGHCNDGPEGSGRCVCAAGYAPPDCRAACPSGAAGGVCSGHGACLAGPACRCAAGYAGPACSVPCPCAPGPAPAVCGGPRRGVCEDGAAGSGRCVCSPGFAGLACERDCPGAGPGGPCTGHGACDALNATCACAPRWARTACDACAAGWYGVDCDRRCYRGRTVARACVCDPGWALEDCSLECAGGAAVPCTGHGMCRLEDGTCMCDAEWRGPRCSMPCAGLLAAGSPCSGHGTCDAAGACECARSAGDGYWAGEACARCAEGYGGPGCRAVCPGFPAVCGGHGTCNAAAAQCECYRSPAEGHWAEASDCTQCLAGFWGSGCQDECPGGSCNVCSGHGVCDAGTAGTGACACDVQWAGPACAQCAVGWSGLECTTACPVGVASDGAVAVCAGHGRCRDGLYGTGQCVCDESVSAGMWRGAACTECAAGHWGPACRRDCPRAEGAVCAGHGACDDGRNGTGACTCDPDFGGGACERTCPAANGRVCNGVGACDPERGLCDCGAAPWGHWAGTACAECRPGWVGGQCDIPCPRGGPRALVCSGHGDCLAPASQVEVGVCACEAGFHGDTCTAECPGGAGFQCSGHGVCSPVTGACACDGSAAAGYWAGAACAACQPDWSGPRCLVPCPVGAGGAACSGFLCRDGACECGGGGVCGAACNVTGPACAALACPPGSWGPGCAGACPRGAGGRVCGGRGACLAATYGDGLCHCERGYAGADCGLLCPGGPAGPCAGHGGCVPATAACACYAGFAGADCALPCPLGRGLVCGGHGTCNDTAAGDGTCSCAEGYAGRDCTALCPGFDPGAADPRSCGGHGECVQASALCSCGQTEGAFFRCILRQDVC